MTGGPARRRTGGPDGTCAQTFAQHAAARRAAIDRYQWSSALNAYVDYRFDAECSH
jgi:neutral trehalase